MIIFFIRATNEKKEFPFRLSLVLSRSRVNTTYIILHFSEQNARALHKGFHKVSHSD